MRHTHPITLWAALVVVCLTACGDDSGASTLTIAKPRQRGDLQTGTAGEALPDSLRLLMTSTQHLFMCGNHVMLPFCRRCFAC